VSRESGFTHDEALAYEWAARCQAGQGLGTMADALLKEAIRCYGQWGAQAKQRELARGRPDLLQIQQQHLREETATVVTSIDALDLESIVKSLHSVSGETGLARVIDRLMVIALEQAGAERGVLMLPAGDGLRRRAEARVGQTGIAVEQLDLAVTPHDVPLSMVQAVLRTHDHVVVEDAQARNPFDADTYFQAGTFRSVLCLPLLRQAEVLGVLYLENGLISNAFTPARGAVLRLLASTAAISIENAGLDEKTALLKEVHHRVKNNLQLISSLLSLQASHIEDPSIARLFAESRDRVRSMALVHENLYRAGNFARVEMSAHLRNLCSQLLRAYRTPYQAIDIRVEATDIEMDMSRAVTCGLIVNELVSNALKHAFPDGRDGCIDVDLARHVTGHCTIRVRDNGAGMAGEGVPRRAGAMGLDLVDDLVAQLHGTLSVSHVGGTAYTIDFPLPGQEH
jgi:two-component sensor histidine kinase